MIHPHRAFRAGGFKSPQGLPASAGKGVDAAISPPRCDNNIERAIAIEIDQAGGRLHAPRNFLPSQKLSVGAAVGADVAVSVAEPHRADNEFRFAVTIKIGNSRR